MTVAAEEPGLCSGGLSEARAAWRRVDSLNSLILVAARVSLALCALLTAWGAFSPSNAMHPHLFPWDKAEHFSAFFALAACALLAFRS